MERATKPGYYWDVEECGWQRCPAPDIPTQAAPVEPTEVAQPAEADVRSG
jgi:hypothetical protein